MGTPRVSLPFHPFTTLYTQRDLPSMVLALCLTNELLLQPVYFYVLLAYSYA